MILAHAPVRWSADPVAVVGLAGAGALYAVGVLRLWAGGRTGRGIRRWQVACFGAGILAEEHARVAGTINYELVCGINADPRRARRVVVDA